MNTRPPRKISLAQCIRQGTTMLTIRCVTPLPPGTSPSGAVGTCFHYMDVPTDRLIRLFGEETSLTDIENAGRFACKKCGGRKVQIS